MQSAWQALDVSITSTDGLTNEVNTYRSQSLMPSLKVMVIRAGQSCNHAFGPLIQLSWGVSTMKEENTVPPCLRS
jgi:hypothetical protein